jgi:hypothetical protein
MPLMGLTLSYTHAHKHTNKAYTQATHGEQNRTDSGGEIDATVRRNKQTQSEKGKKG